MKFSSAMDGCSHKLERRYAKVHPMHELERHSGLATAADELSYNNC